MMGHDSVHRPVVRAILGEALRKKAGRLHFVRVALERRPDGGLVARPSGSQSSGVLTSMVRGQGLAVFPAEAERMEAGDPVAVQVLDPGFFDGRDRGF